MGTAECPGAQDVSRMSHIQQQLHGMFQPGAGSGSLCSQQEPHRGHEPSVPLLAPSSIWRIPQSPWISFPGSQLALCHWCCPHTWHCPHAWCDQPGCPCAGDSVQPGVFFCWMSPGVTQPCPGMSPGVTRPCPGMFSTLLSRIPAHLELLLSPFLVNVQCGIHPAVSLVTPI